jgi:hypothetical protein
VRGLSIEPNKRWKLPSLSMKRELGKSKKHEPHWTVSLSQKNHAGRDRKRSCKRLLIGHADSAWPMP